MPERDAIWAKHDRLSPALAAEMLAFAGRMEQERNEARKRLSKLTGALRACLPHVPNMEPIGAAKHSEMNQLAWNLRKTLEEMP
jgi:hypothetical protein